MFSRSDLSRNVTAAVGALFVSVTLIGASIAPVRADAVVATIQATTGQAQA